MTGKKQKELTTKIRDSIFDYVADTFGMQEARNPSWNIKALAEYVAIDLCDKNFKPRYTFQCDYDDELLDFSTVEVMVEDNVTFKKLKDTSWQVEDGMLARNENLWVLDSTEDIIETILNHTSERVVSIKLNNNVIYNGDDND